MLSYSRSLSAFLDSVSSDTIRIIDTLQWYKTWHQSRYNQTHVKQKLHRKRRRACKSSWSRQRNQKVIYTDNILEFGKSCEDLSWNHSTSTSHRSETNGIVERVVRRIKEEDICDTVVIRSGRQKGVYVTPDAKPKWLPCPTVVTWRDKTLWSIDPSRPKRRRDDYEWIDDGDGALENSKNE